MTTSKKERPVTPARSGGAGAILSTSESSPCTWCSRAAVTLGTWGCRPLLFPALSLSHLRSTPQAVAREAGTASGGMVVGSLLAGSIRDPPYEQLLVGLGVAGSTRMGQ
jgi:hypothetical protein